MQNLDDLPVPAWVSFVHSSFHPQPKDTQIRSTDNSKLAIGVKVTVNSCSSLC